MLSRYPETPWERHWKSPAISAVNRLFWFQPLCRGCAPVHTVRHRRAGGKVREPGLRCPCFEPAAFHAPACWTFLPDLRRRKLHKTHSIPICVVFESDFLVVKLHFWNEFIISVVFKDRSTWINYIFETNKIGCGVLGWWWGTQKQRLSVSQGDCVVFISSNNIEKEQFLK